MKSRLWIILGIAAGLALLAWALWPAALQVETGRVSQGRFERSVQEDGKTRLRDRYLVSAPLTGQLERVTLQQGDTVERDQVLASLRPALPDLLNERSRQEQRERIGALEASLARAQTQVERAQAALEKTRADLRRSETLTRQGFLSPTQNETERLNLRLREKELEGAQQEAHAARHQLDQSRIAIRQFASGAGQASARSWLIRSPIGGKVLKIHQQSEGRVQAGTPLMELGDPSRLEVVVDLLTEDAAQIRAGTPAQLSNWGGPAVLQAVVRLIEPAAFTKVSALGVEEQRVHVVLDISTDLQYWRSLGDGYKVDVRLQVQAVEQALKVPVSALFPSGARSALFAVELGRAHLREVEVLARNGEEALIKSSLGVGSEVVIYPPAKLKDGQRVRQLKAR
ncbi:MAG: efflux RND transporter periplasmic adaptor subunit [Hylemonella sp.]